MTLPRARATRGIALACLTVSLVAGPNPALASPDDATSEALAACDARIRGWEAFQAEIQQIDWSQDSWKQRSYDLMQDLYATTEVNMKSCPTPRRRWTNTAYSLITISFALHQPAKYEDYAAQIEGLVAEILANIRHQREFVAAGDDAPVASNLGAPSDLGVLIPGLAAPGHALMLPSWLLFMQALPAHCTPQKEPRVRDCDGSDVDDALDCLEDNLNDVAKYTKWSDEGWAGAGGSLADIGLAFVPGAGLVQAAMAGDAAGMASGTVSTAATIAQHQATTAGARAAGKLLGGVMTALEVQGHTMMFLINAQGSAINEGQARFARIRVEDCLDRLKKAQEEYNACLALQGSDQAAFDAVQAHNDFALIDPECDPPPPTPPPPSPEEIEKKRLEKEQIERRKEEADKDLGRRATRLPEDPKDPKDPSDPIPIDPITPSLGISTIGGPQMPTSFFDVFFDMTVEDAWKPAPTTTADAPETKTADAPRGPTQKGGPSKGLLIGGAAVLVGGVAVAAGGGGSDGSGSTTPGGGSTAAPPNVSVNVSPDARGMAGLTEFALTASGAGSATCNWELGDGSTGTGNSVSKVYAAAGSYDVSVTCRNSGGTTTRTATITVERDMAGAWAGPFNNRNTVLQLNPASSSARAFDQSLTGSYSDQFDSGSLSGALAGNGVCPCDLRLDIVVPGVATFAFEGRRVDENTLVGQYVGDFPAFATTLTRQ